MASSRTKLNNFFLSVQGRSLRQVEIATGDRDEALDILQEAMIRLAKKYAEKETEWPMLFQKILQNLIRDWYRRKKVRSILVFWQGKSKLDTSGNAHETDIAVEVESLLPEHSELLNLDTPEKHLCQQGVVAELRRAVSELPMRQQQAFTLRAWLGHDTKETAYAMGVSEGSVKTHYSRAIKRLRDLLEDLEYEQQA